MSTTQRRSILLSAVLLLLFGLPTFGGCLAQAQPISSPSPATISEESKAEKQYVYAAATLVADTTAVVPGKPFKLGVRLQMQPGWHTYYKDSGDAGMPTKITWQLPKGFTASALEWQRPHKFDDSGIVTYGYQDKTLIASTVTPAADLKPGQKLTFTAKVKWLTCKDVCVPGDTTVTITLDSAASANSIDREEFASLGFNGPVSQIEGETGHTEKAVAAGARIHSSDSSIINADIKVADSAGDHLSFAAYIGLAFIGGFILNFMPCVLPVISIKVLSFMQQAGDDPKRVFKLGLTFTAGIVSSFLALAAAVVGIQAAGSKIGWGFQFQFPLFLLGMAALVLVFALSLFGLFYIHVNAGQDQIDKLAEKEGFTGTFFKGVLATTLSTPCSAPFLGTALGFAFSQPAWVVFLIFLTIALGMSFPYMVLTAQPGWMKFLPKPGLWMEKFKESMGFLLLATVVWLMWVLGQQVGLNAAMAAIGFLVVLSFVVWLVGRFTDLTSTGLKKSVIYAIAALIMGLSYFGLLAPFPQLLSLNPAATEPANASAVSSVNHFAATGGVTSDGIDWMPFSVAELDKQLKAGKTVFIDFTADWCLTCKVNENSAINTPIVRATMKQLNVVAMRADWTAQNPDISAILNKFGRQAVPLYVIFPGAKPESPIVLPDGIITASSVARNLQQAGPSK